MSSSAIFQAMRPTLPSHIDPLTVLIEEAAISKLQSYFAISVDQRNFENLRNVFSEDVVTDYGLRVGETTGIEHLFARLKAVTEPVTSQHVLGSQLITLETTTKATCITYIIGNASGKGNKEAKTTYTVGRYEDRLEKRAQGWRIVERNLKYMTLAKGPGQGDASIFDGDAA